VAESVLLDTSAIFTFLCAEEGAAEVEKFLRAAARGSLTVFASFATVAELFSAAMKKAGREQAEYYLSLVKAWPVTWIQSDEALCVSAGALKGCHKMSLADAFIAATALRHDAVLVHKDPEFEALKTFVRQHVLPYKQGKG
jgi:predicted nucleic acid-binding protein